MSHRLKNRTSLSAELLYVYTQSSASSKNFDECSHCNLPFDDFFLRPFINEISFKSKLALSTRFLKEFEFGRQNIITNLESLIVKNSQDTVYETWGIKLTPSSHLVVGNIKMTVKDFIERAIEICTPAPEEYEDYVINTLKAIKRLSPLFSIDLYSEKLQIKKEKACNISKEINSNKSKPWLAIDLDETLIHSETLNHLNKGKEYSILITSLNIGINIRPYLTEFLSSISKYYNLILFTAGEEEYAQCVIEALNIKQFFGFILSRDFCVDLEGLIFIKDLDILGEDANILLVDNSIFSFAKHLKNGVLVSSYYSNQSDTELLDLLDYLVELLETSSSAEIKVDGNLETVAQTIIIKNEKHFWFETIFHSIDF